MRQAKREFWKKYKVIFAFMLFMIGFMVTGALTNDPVTSLVMANIIPIVWIKGGKFTQELTQNELEKLSAEEYAVYVKELNESRIHSLKVYYDAQLKELMSKSDYDKLKAEFASKTEYEQLVKLTEKLSAELETFKQGSGDNNEPATREEAIRKGVADIITSKGFVEWVAGGMKPNESPKVTVKYTIASNRTGNVTITEQSDYVRPLHEVRSINMRDLIGVMPTDLPFLTFDKITGETGDASVTGENGNATVMNYATAETTVSPVRIAGCIDISKRAMKGVKWLTAYLNKKLPDRLKRIEDFEILYGDASTNHLDGLVKNAIEFDLTDATFVATSFSSVATWNSAAQALVTFAAAHNLKNGYKITIANATHAGYNGTFVVNVKSSTEIIIDHAYTAEADVSAWTAVSYHGLYHAIDSATEADVLLAVRGFLSNSEYPVTGHVINPAMASKIEMLKETTGGYLSTWKNNVERRNGVLYVGGVPCVETNAMPYNKFLSGSFADAVELLQFEELTLSFVTDTTYAKANKVMALIEEDILLPIYNPNKFVFGDFTTAKTALETP